VGQLLLDLHRQEQTVLVVVTHSLDLARTLPRRAEMADGTLRPLEEGRHDVGAAAAAEPDYHWRGNLAVFLGWWSARRS